MSCRKKISGGSTCSLLLKKNGATPALFSPGGPGAWSAVAPKGLRFVLTAGGPGLSKGTPVGSRAAGSALPSGSCSLTVSTPEATCQGVTYLNLAPLLFAPAYYSWYTQIVVWCSFCSYIRVAGHIYMAHIASPSRTVINFIVCAQILLVI